jgi:hypothetical protein
LDFSSPTAGNTIACTESSGRASDASATGKFGLSQLDEAGYWWIAANLLRDVAALNNMEMLPWDV